MSLQFEDLNAKGACGLELAGLGIEPKGPRRDGGLGVVCLAGAKELASGDAAGGMEARPSLFYLIGEALALQDDQGCDQEDAQNADPEATARAFGSAFDDRRGRDLEGDGRQGLGFERLSFWIPPDVVDCGEFKGAGLLHQVGDGLGALACKVAAIGFVVCFGVAGVDTNAVGRDAWDGGQRHPGQLRSLLCNGPLENGADFGRPRGGIPALVDSERLGRYEKADLLTAGRAFDLDLKTGTQGFDVIDRTRKVVALRKTHGEGRNFERAFALGEEGKLVGLDKPGRAFELSRADDGIPDLHEKRSW